MFHAVCLQIVPAKMENPDNEDIIIPVCILLIAAGIQQYREIYPIILSPVHTNGGDSICSFDQITSLLFFPFQPCFIYHVTDVLLFVDFRCCNLLTSNKDLRLVRDKNVSWSLLYRIELVLSQSVYHATSKSCMIQSNSTVYTVFFGWWYKHHDTCFTV